MEKFLHNLKTQAEENPVAALAVGAVLLTAASRFIGSGVAAANSRVWSKEVARRAAKTAIK